MDKKTIKAFNFISEQFADKTKDYWTRFSSQFIYEFAKMISGKVLDVGSGPGRDALILANLGLEVVCLDASQEMIKISSQKGLKSILGDFMNIPFENEHFDGVWAYTSLLHIPSNEIKEALLEISRVLKKNGVLGLGLIEGQKGESGYYEFWGPGSRILYSYFNEEEVKSLLESIDFKIISFKKLKTEGVPRSFLHFLAQRRGNV